MFYFNKLRCRNYIFKQPGIQNKIQRNSDSINVTTKRTISIRIFARSCLLASSLLCMPTAWSAESFAANGTPQTPIYFESCIV